MIISRDFDTVPGLSEFSSAEIYAVRILGLDRSGTGQTQRGYSDHMSLTGRQFAYNGSFLYFDPDNPFNEGEKLTILYEI